jgi:ribulose 1,5-bisphosphate synthetase/thiazole synthase
VDSNYSESFGLATALHLHRKHLFSVAMSSENLLKSSKKRVVIVGAGAAGMVSQAVENLPEYALQKEVSE